MIAITEQLLDSGLIQLGFAGFSLIILGFLFWLVKQLLASNLRSDKVMARLTDAIKTLEMSMSSQLTAMKEAQEATTSEVRKLTETVKSSPCVQATTTRGN